MGNVVEVMDDESSNNIVRHEDVQLDLYLKIHDKVNARSEEISKSYNDNILVCFEDIKELHFKNLQSIRSLNPAKDNLGVQIAVSHHEGESEKFNSFEEFEKHNITSPNPTANIILLYTFTLYNTETEEFENYKIINQVRSRIGELQQIEKEAPPFISSALISSMVTTTARITVHYCDYVKARHFTAMFDEWIKGCDESKSLKMIAPLQRISHLVRKFGTLTIYGLLALFTASAIDTQQISSDLTLKFLVIYASTFVIIGNLADTLLSKVESAIDSYLAMSYLKLNKGDAKLVTEFSQRNKKSLIWSGLGVTGTLLIGLFTNYVYDLIKWVI
ncbi:hypothetical protein J8L84_11080 [Alteromonas sp. MMG017]|uniref:hypothetical protein n=1 Tax=Alteromonas sp. MMG017 TaxID=2822692 RepID=UPI001B3A3317|nr:hypothetical protein [Alteromonas sp. MMG017]MBQ4829818.1 hypothetical protein [Alteromonas sp. MMG017]